MQVQTMLKVRYKADREFTRLPARQDIGVYTQARFTFGVYHSEAEFVKKVIAAGHPRDWYGQLPVEMQNCVDALSVMLALFGHCKKSMLAYKVLHETEIWSVPDETRRRELCKIGKADVDTGMCTHLHRGSRVQLAHNAKLP